MNEPAQPQQPQKKGLSTGAKIAIGCVGLLLLSAIVAGIGMFWLGKKAIEVGSEMMENPAKSMAEMAIKADPDTEFISSDDQTVTFRTKDGEVMTMNFEDIRQGRFSMTTEGGETSTISIGEGGITGTRTDEGGEATDFSVFGSGTDTSNVPVEVQYPRARSMSATVASRGGGWWEGMITYQTSSSMDEVVEWQRDALDDCEITRTDVAGTRNASFTCGEDTVNLTFMGEQVMANYRIRDE